MALKILKIVGYSLAVLALVSLCLFAYFNFPVGTQNDKTELGVTFSHRYAADIGMDWRKIYLAVLDELGVKKVRIPVYWNLVEKNDGEYDFADVDWQLEEARKRNVEVILVIGQKVPRWPECAIPEWLEGDDERRKASLKKFLAIAVERYKNNSAIKYWQVENEPFLLFGICPTPDAQLLDSEIDLVRKLDPTRQIIITDSGELSLWVMAAKRGDVFGTTMYRNVYKEGFGYYVYPLGPRFFRLKYRLIDMFVGQKNAVVIELQAEPWIAGWTTNQPLEEQFKSMTADKLVENVSFAKKVGFPQVYLWGAEWWYWLRAEKDMPEVWDTAKELFATDYEY